MDVLLSRSRSPNKLNLVALLVCVIAVRAWGDGHGPAFGFSTATLGSGDASFEAAAMWRSGQVMIGPRMNYGIRSNLQFTFSSPFDVTHGEHPTGRFSAMMSGTPEAEALLGWRFYHATPSVSTRNEATLYVGGSATTQQIPRIDSPPLERQPALYTALAAGRVARSYDIWAGVGYQRYANWNSTELDHQSNTLLATFAVGWRPSFLNGAYPKPDVRLFWESTGEVVGLARVDITSTGAGSGGGVHSHAIIALPLLQTGVNQLPDSGGRAVFTGPSFLCTYKSIAFQGGVLFAAFDQPNGNLPHEKVRAAVGISYYILGHRK